MISESSLLELEDDFSLNINLGYWKGEWEQAANSGECWDVKENVSKWPDEVAHGTRRDWA